VTQPLPRHSPDTRRRFLSAAVTAALGMACGAWPAIAQAQAQAQAPASTYPDRPIKVIVPFTPGGTTDAMARAIGQKLTESWGQPVVVENKPGAAGWLGITQVAKAPADGYTIGLTISNIIYAHSLYAKLPFDMQRDFEPVSMLSRSAIGLAVAAHSPANTLEEFVALVRKNPGKYSYGSFGQGTSAHIFGEALNLHGKLDLAHVPYKGAAPIVNDLLGGQVSSAFIDSATLRPLLQGGKIKVLAVSGTQRVGVMPNVPTFLELGWKGFEPVGFFMVLAPAGTPKDIVRKLSDGIARAVRSDDLSAKLREFGQDPVGGPPEQLAAGIRNDAETFDRAIKASNIKVDQP